MGEREEIGSHSERGRVERWGEREEIGSHSERGRVESWGGGKRLGVIVREAGWRVGGGKRLGIIVREAGWRVGGREEIGSHSERGRVESWGRGKRLGVVGWLLNVPVTW